MKTITLIFIPLLLALGANAIEISSNSTKKQYSKPGAPIDMHYTSEKVDMNETSDVNITLSTTIRNGTVSVFISLDKNLKSLTDFDENLTYEVMPEQQEHVINLQVKSQQQGLYYIRLLTKVNKGYGIKLRSFAVPIYIGKEAGIKNKVINLQMKALGSGENISVSQALETIEPVNGKN
jgi:hypothetical protein